jgi:hypothetical protein
MAEWRGEVYRLHFSREDDDVQFTPDNQRLPVLRISLGGHPDVGYYCKFRGDPEEVVKLLHVMHEAAKEMLPVGRYEDMRHG